MSELTHFNKSGEAYMVDIGTKPITRRKARAEGYIEMQSLTLEIIMQGGSHKGDVLGIARIAGIMAAKKTAELIPLCHPLALSCIELELRCSTEARAVYCIASVETTGQTGVEMEALTAVQIALLTVYDMCKVLDRGMTIGGVRLLEKQGGKSGDWQRHG